MFNFRSQDCLQNTKFSRFTITGMSLHRIDHSGVEYVLMELRNDRVMLVNVQSTDIVLVACVCVSTWPTMSTVSHEPSVFTKY